MLERAPTWLGFAVVLALAISTTAGFFERILYSRQYVVGAAVVFSSEHRSQIGAKVTIAASEDHRMLVFPSDTSEARELQKQAIRARGGLELVDPHNFALVESSSPLQERAGGLSVFEGEEGVERVIELLRRQHLASSRPNYFWLTGLLSIGVGLTFGRRLVGLTALAPVLAMTTCAGLLYVRCKTCMSGLTDEFLAETAIIAFAILSVVTMFGSRVSFALVFASASICVLVQIGLSWSVAQGPCPFCIILLSVAATAVGVGLCNKGISQPILPTLGTRSIGLLCFAGTTLLLVLSYTEAPLTARGGRGKDFELTGYGAFEGLPSSALDIRHSRTDERFMPTTPTVVVLGSESCDACRFAFLWASTQPEFNSLFVQVSEQAPTTESAYTKYWTPKTDKLTRTPAILLIGRGGRILDAIGDWSTDPKFCSAVSDRFLARLKQTGETQK